MNEQSVIKRKAYMKEYNRLYLIKNKAERKAYMRDYMKSYRVLNVEKLKPLKKKYYLKYKTTDNYKNYKKSGNYRFQKYKEGAKIRNYLFDLSKEQFADILNNKCHYCGSSDNIGIDRKDNNIGYTFNNSLPCCSDCNYFKRSFDYDWFIEKCKSISSFVVKVGRV